MAAKERINDQERVLAVLREANQHGDGWVRTDVLQTLSRAFQVQARVSDLRKEWVIAFRRVPGEKLGEYRLMGPRALADVREQLAGIKVWVLGEGDDLRVECAPLACSRDKALAERLAAEVEATVRRVLRESEGNGYSESSPFTFSFFVSAR